ncbi:unnamed protein product [Macrosiphum euphorbiae]|uniref:Uncharacterized protein n=1 Tax=Macrosiphum euphorbiae TaxID=13131 RepID=A0AAV0VMU5_9HEMI|nr:unnamed protein product [Macrosiphum euphorbiae]
MNCLSIVLVIALVGYSLGAPQYGEYGLEEEHEQINPKPQNGSNQRNGNNREYGNSQVQGEGTKGGRIQGRGSNQRQGEYRQPEHGGYPAPEQQYGNNPGYGVGSQQYRQVEQGPNNQGHVFNCY